MCGIAGVFSFKSRTLPSDTAALLSRMAGLISHRGPDEWGYYLNRSLGIGMAHSCLSIIDRASGKQPMISGAIVLSFVSGNPMAFFPSHAR